MTLRIDLEMGMTSLVLQRGLRGKFSCVTCALPTHDEASKLNKPAQHVLPYSYESVSQLPSCTCWANVELQFRSFFCT